MPGQKCCLFQMTAVLWLSIGLILGGCSREEGRDSARSSAAAAEARDELPASIEVLTEDGRLELTGELARLIRELAEETGASLEEPVHAGSGSDSLSEMVRKQARKGEKMLATHVGWSSDPEPRGPGGVLTSGKVPRKVMARGVRIFLYDEKGHPRKQMKPAVPYFVFEHNDGWLLVGRIQDREVTGGWLREDDCFPWYSRRLMYPLNVETFSRKLVGESGEGEMLAAFSPSSTMPWPVLYEDREKGKVVVLADLRELDGEVLPLKMGKLDRFAFFVLFSETELNRSLASLTRLAGILDSGRMPVKDTAKVLGSFLAQSNVDFLDTTEIRRCLDLFPGGSPGFLIGKELSKRFERIRKSLETQIAWLLHISNSLGFYNESHASFVLPLELLHLEESK